MDVLSAGKKSFLIAGVFCLSAFCTKSKSNNDYLVSLLAESYVSPFITSMSAQRGSPSQSISGETYSATEVIVKGRGFIASLTDNTVTFNGTAATVTYASTTELRTSVPAGATSGIFSIVNKGGSCSSYDKRSGTFCATNDFYIDCYTPYSGVHGDETLVEYGKTTTVEYSTSGTKAFKSYLNSGSNTISISCDNYFTGIIVRYFTSSCVPTQETYTTNPISISLTGPYTAQYFVTGISGNCTITHN